MCALKPQCFSEQELLDLQIIQRGHFVLTSGKHSDKYVEKFRLLEKPALVERACANLLTQIKGLAFDVVVGPATGGIIVAHELARQAGTDAIYVESVNGKKELRRGAIVPEHSRVLIADDVLTTGLSIYEIAHLLSTMQKVTIVGACVLFDRSQNIKMDIPHFSAQRIEAQIYPANEIPDWLQAVPVTKPGTR